MLLHILSSLKNRAHWITQIAVLSSVHCIKRAASYAAQFDGSFSMRLFYFAQIKI
jgi:hypothetical protein